MLYQFLCTEAHEELGNTMGLLSLCFWGNCMEQSENCSHFTFISGGVIVSSRTDMLK